MKRLPLACGSKSAQAQDVPVFVEHVNQHQPPALLQEKIARMPAAGQLYLGTKSILFDLHVFGPFVFFGTERRE